MGAGIAALPRLPAAHNSCTHAPNCFLLQSFYALMVVGSRRSGGAGAALALLMVLLCHTSSARAAEPCTSGMSGALLCLLSISLKQQVASKAAPSDIACCTAQYRAGSFTADLFSTGGGACNSSPWAKCLSSFSLTAGVRGGNCGITLTPLAASGVTISELWTPAGSGSYAKYVTCPTSALTATVGSSASISEILTAARGVLNSALWSTAVNELAADPAVAGGVFSFTAAACTLQYRITSSTGIAGAETAACAGVAGCQTNAPCAAGQYAVAVSGLSKTCALCPPGEGGAAVRGCCEGLLRLPACLPAIDAAYHPVLAALLPSLH